MSKFLPSVMRILDANFNRAREALRVMEEAARFLLDDETITRDIKQLRHDLSSVLSQRPNLTENRDTPGDVGTTIQTESESQRADVVAVVTAACKRLSEALRAMEEYGKLLPKTGGNGPGLATRIEALRYRGYDTEKRLLAKLSPMGVRQWRLCVLLTQSLCRDGDWLRVAQEAIEGGADCLQLREKSLDASELIARAQQLVKLARPRGVSVIVNDRPDIALASGADGVHLGQHDLSCSEVRGMVGRQLIVGVSTSNLDQARRAKEQGADYCGVGPMFPTSTKHKDVIVGPDYLRAFLAWGQLPGVAIGGITPGNVQQLVSVGCRGVAVSSAVCAADDPCALCVTLCGTFDT
ncbi:MAG: thiamine phosphate synthase [Phycisphaera sp.]|nr:thiamine phosphate synthase [Phycisphaera sp.]